MSQVKYLIGICLLNIVSLSPYCQEFKTATLDSAYKVELKIPYCSVDGKRLTMNAFLPKKSGNPSPVMVDIHGGWWFGGEPLTKPPRYFLDKRIAVISIEYRLGKDGGFPENLRDCRNAVRFIRKNAVRFNIDPKRIGCMGGSAGAHLSLMVAMVPEDFNDGGPTEGLQGISASVCNCFSNVAPTDLVRFWNQGPDDVLKSADGMIIYRVADNSIPNDCRPRLRILFHGIAPDTKEHQDLYTRMSPIGNVRKGIPPLLFCDGEIDSVVPGLHGDALNKKLKAAGVDATYWITVGKGHADPGGEGFLKILDDFLSRTLKLDLDMS